MSDAGATRPEPSAVERTAVLASVVGGAALVGSVVAAAIRALADRWYPVGDNALFAIRARDVFTEHHPLVGTSTSASEAVGVDFNNPGPLLFDLYAWAAKVGPGALPLGVAVVVLGCVGVLAVCAHRVAGPRGVLLALFASTALAWAMGPELVIDPWQPHALLFPFLALIGTTWAVAAGSDGALLAVAGLSSLVVQTHLSYAPLVAVSAGSAAVIVSVRAVRDPARRRPASRIGVATAGLLAVLWAQPLWEQVTADDQGNLSRIAGVPAADRGESVGPEVAVRVAGAVLDPLLGWAPPSFSNALEQLPLIVPFSERFVRLPSLPVAVALLASTGGLLVAVGLLARRRGASVVAAGAAVAGATAATAVLTAAMLPVAAWGLPPHHVRWLWPVAIAVTAALASAVLARRAGVVVVGAASVAMALLAVVPTEMEVGPAGATDVAGPALRQLTDQLDDLDLAGPLLLETGPLAIDDQYTVPILLELDRRFGVRVEDPVLVRQLGDGREATGDEHGRVVVRRGDAARQGPPGWERIGFVAGLTPAQEAELDRLGEVVAHDIGGEGLELTPRGRAALGERGMPPVERVVGRDVDPVEVLGAEALRGVVVAEFVLAPGAQDDLERWAGLHHRAHAGTVGLWLERDGRHEAKR